MLNDSPAHLEQARRALEAWRYRRGAAGRPGRYQLVLDESDEFLRHRAAPIALERAALALLRGVPGRFRPPGLALHVSATLLPVVLRMREGRKAAAAADVFFTRPRDYVPVESFRPMAGPDGRPVWLEAGDLAVDNAYLDGGGKLLRMYREASAAPFPCGRRSPRPSLSFSHFPSAPPPRCVCVW